MRATPRALSSEKNFVGMIARRHLITRIRKVMRQPEQVASFVLGACRLVVRNQRRGRTRREGLLHRFAGDFPRRAESDHSPLLDRGRLGECLARLAFRERTVLVLTFYAELASAEIAARLCLTADNVRTTCGPCATGPSSACATA